MHDFDTMIADLKAVTMAVAVAVRESDWANVERLDQLRLQRLETLAAHGQNPHAREAVIAALLSAQAWEDAVEAAIASARATHLDQAGKVETGGRACRAYIRAMAA